MFDIILSFVTALSLTYFAIPSIIAVAVKKNLMDDIDERRAHTVRTPSLGGIGIFMGMVFSITLWTPFSTFADLQYILCAFIIIFMIGAKDDIMPISPWNKLLGEIAAATIIVFKSNIRITSVFGIFGIETLPYWVSVILSIFVIIVVINAFNLIDGINGLSGSIAVLISVVLGTWFFLTNQMDMAIIAFAMTGAVIAFLKYNFTPAEIFMGDTGALLIGLVTSILTIRFMQFHEQFPEHAYAVRDVPAVVIGILILPLFDTLRVFITRLADGKSPLYPDRSHIHHLLLDYGLSHMKATSLLVFVNIGFIAMVILLQGIGTYLLLFLVVGLAAGLSGWLYYTVKRKKAATTTEI